MGPGHGGHAHERLDHQLACNADDLLEAVARRTPGSSYYREEGEPISLDHARFGREWYAVFRSDWSVRGALVCGTGERMYVYRCSY